MHFAIYYFSFTFYHIYYIGPSPAPDSCTWDSYTPAYTWTSLLTEALNKLKERNMWSVVSYHCTLNPSAPFVILTWTNFQDDICWPLDVWHPLNIYFIVLIHPSQWTLAIPVAHQQLSNEREIRSVLGVLTIAGTSDCRWLDQLSEFFCER